MHLVLSSYPSIQLQKCSKLQETLNDIQHKSYTKFSPAIVILDQSDTFPRPTSLVCLECTLVSHTNKMYSVNSTSKMQLPILATFPSDTKVKTRPEGNAISKCSFGCTRIYQR
jgi:hypothetical protein